MPPRTTTDESKTVEIHVIGAGKGESIILGWPGNHWGVVDCYAPSLTDHTTNPTFQFLRDRGVKQLEFVCLTHPHEDHFRGMSQIFEQFTVRYFWRFPTLSARDLKLLAKYFILDSSRADVVELKENANDFVRTMAIVEERRKANELKQLMPTGYQQLYPIPLDQAATFQIWSFAPNGNQLAQYEKKLVESFTVDGTLLANPPSLSHNDISVGLIILFGKTRIFLGGDIEQPAWRDIVAQHQREFFFSDAVKVPHHGSVTGYIPNLWQDFAGKTKPIAVIAPYKRFGLPNREALRHISEHASTIMLTSPITETTRPMRLGPMLKSRLALRAKFKARAASTAEECGRCSLRFDDAGNCFSANEAGPACKWEPEPE